MDRFPLLILLIFMQIVLRLYMLVRPIGQRKIDSYVQIYLTAVKQVLYEGLARPLNNVPDIQLKFGTLVYLTYFLLLLEVF